MYAGAQTDRGWSVLDVTDPGNPKVLNWIPGPANTRTGELDIADGKLITPLERSQMGGDTDPKKPWDEGAVIWSLADPVHPRGSVSTRPAISARIAMAITAAVTCTRPRR